MGFGEGVSVSRWMLALAPGRCSTHITGRRQAADGSLANRVRSGTKQPHATNPGAVGDSDKPVAAFSPQKLFCFCGIFLHKIYSNLIIQLHKDNGYEKI